MSAAAPRPALPLAVWVGLLGGAAVLSVLGVVGAVLAAEGDLSASAVQALAGGGCAGLLICLVAVLAAARLAASLRSLHDVGVRRSSDGATLAPSHRWMLTPATLELAELARVLEALHARARVADELGERHRREAETTGAGVFELLSGLVAAEEGARGQLAAELHDTVAQSLMIARGLLAAAPSTPSELAKLADYVQDAEEQVRAVMARTRPPALRDGDLASAVGNLRLDMGARYGLVVTVEWPESPYPLPLASAVTVYRFFQEALLNVVKHADVDDAVASLRMDPDAVVAQVRDEGAGFDPSAVRPDPGRHVGLGLLRERARLSGGTLDVVSRLGTGSTLTLRLPRPQGLVPEPVVDPPSRVSELPRLRRISDRV